MLRALKGFREHVQAVNEHRRELQEIDALDDRAIEDLGLSREELRKVVTTTSAVAERMAAMARRHGLDPDQLDRFRHDYVHLLDTCAHCQATDLCAKYLADVSEGPLAAGFCPNHADYMALKGTRA
jgi:uncharacterized protein YjiS (DUF1127 family)